MEFPDVEPTLKDLCVQNPLTSPDGRLLAVAKALMTDAAKLILDMY